MLLLNRLRSPPWIFSSALIWFLFLPLNGFAQTGSESDNDNWSFKVGVGVFAAPEYNGSDELDFLPFPSIEATYKDIFFASVIDGIGVNFIREENWGATFSWAGTMREKLSRSSPLMTVLCRSWKSLTSPDRFACMRP